MQLTASSTLTRLSRTAAPLALALACTGCVLAATPTRGGCVASEGLAVHAGPGYCISYPTGATVERLERPTGDQPWARITRRDMVESHWIQGESVKSWRPVEQHGEEHWVGSEAPIYWLSIAVYENPEGLHAETWARERILSDWREAKAEGAPLGGAPVQHYPPDRPLERAVILEDRVGRATLAGYPAFRATFQGGASVYHRYYLKSGPYIVTVQYEDNPVENVPLARAQQHAAYLLLSTLRLQ
jgi:hypothetical protein